MRALFVPHMPSAFSIPIPPRQSAPNKCVYRLLHFWRQAVRTRLPAWTMCRLSQKAWGLPYEENQPFRKVVVFVSSGVNAAVAQRCSVASLIVF